MTDRPFHFGVTRFASGGTHHLEGEFTILFLVVEGHATIQNQNSTHDLGSYRCGLYQGKSGIDIHFPQETFARTLKCSVSVAAEAVLESLSKLPPTQARPASDQIVTLLRLGAALNNSNSDADLRLHDALGAAALHAYAAQAHTAAGASVPVTVSKARLHIEQHYSEDWDLAELARISGVSKEYLVSSFRRHYGMTPIRYLWDLRTNKAVSLVENTNLNLAEISARCGYKSPFHLSREIKRITGSSPREMRRATG